MTGLHEGLEPALGLLDRLLGRAVEAVMAVYGTDHDPRRGLYLDPEEIARLVRLQPRLPFRAPDERSLLDLLDPGSRPAELAARFQLTGFDLGVLVIALAPELDLRYERLYAFLNDDVSRQRPTVDLALTLLSASPGEKLARLQHFAPDAPLVRHGLLRVARCRLAEPIQVAEPVVRHLLGLGGLPPWCELADPGDRPAEPAPGRHVYLSGADGPAKREVALGIAAAERAPLLILDVATAVEAGWPQALEAALLEAALREAVFLVDDVDELDDPGARRAFLRALAGRGATTLVAGTGAAPDGFTERTVPGRRAARRLLARLAQRVLPRHGWDDLVLPADTVEQLHELCTHVRHRDQVLGTWGFGSAPNPGRGVTALFSGPSGTGKTSAAEIVAGDLGLDLYRIDLSAVVSKYVGETEKNLSRIFDAAEESGAILFFDECDALYGKRSEVRDSHDRYANIETAFLLQRMDDYDGVAILASNLRQNMDDAFTRRLRFVIEFPVPTRAQRLRIWRRHLPAQAEVEPGLDLESYAEQFKLTGGNIRNIVLSAAYQAAAEGCPIGDRHLLHATHREHQKLGRPVNGFQP
ncbi:ATP-binding protein [Nonomuraea jiangxiensis]|uniref:ATPase family associated with various cellular activities (AAA) n=1 Tax=Nonomuraea jiangxiensis TaxID=633440 RepID=A0A1G9EVY9_9ACTN|nr:ATP-binding protein [Nonomuraea jiangxiensis]SDK80332.1 ATPase family associated with various cellular activities (AAA) [Nonomuraea jiangxiensis]